MYMYVQMLREVRGQLQLLFFSSGAIHPVFLRQGLSLIIYVKLAVGGPQESVFVSPALGLQAHTATPS